MDQLANLLAKELIMEFLLNSEPYGKAIEKVLAQACVANDVIVTS